VKMLRDFGHAVGKFREASAGNLDAYHELGYEIITDETGTAVRPKTPDLSLALLFPHNPARRTVIQLPHLQDETFLYPIGMHFLEQSRVQGLWVNTVPRTVFDPAHILNSHFSAATIAWSPLVDCFVQLHGCIDLKGEDVIVSSGSWVPSARAVAIYQELRDTYGRTVHLYPFDTFRLGGTTNFQGRVLRDKGSTEQFIHIELSLSLRRSIKTDANSLIEFSNSLLRGIDKQVTFAHKDLVPLWDPWTSPLGLQARRVLGGKGILLAVLGMTEAQFAAYYGEPPKLRRLAKDLGITPTELRPYLDVVEPQEPSGRSPDAAGEVWYE
jgi:hypothetical protein